MSYDWPLDKLSVINRCLGVSGDNLCNTADDGSDEWNTASPAYEEALSVLIEDANWGFATKVVTLTASPTPPADTAWDTAFVLPPDLAHIVWVKINRNTSDPVAGVVNRPLLYDILAGQLVCNAQGGPPPPVPPQVPGIVTMKLVSRDNADPVNATPRFVRALQAFTMSGIYRGLHEDTTEAARLWQAGEQFAQQARTRYDQQKPKRQLWNSRITASRRGRRPWPTSGNNGWSG